MWVQDEPLLQEELARTISQLIHVVNTPEAQHLFVQTFWQTMNREWTGIDQLRLDKYCMLIRLVLRQCFEVLKRDGWEESRITRFLDVLMKEVLHPESRSPDGVKFHCIDVYLDELSKVGGKEVSDVSSHQLLGLRAGGTGLQRLCRQPVRWEREAEAGTVSPAVVEHESGQPVI
ncbi:Ribosomal RNA processing protein 1 like protein B [Pteropus alecto]|uniref:Ribosomal RNA processing protein 1 like protein B n=1 Tax=Pteropus alecto TaxID=9402 RepID=L5KCG5_PTEAL|nr:Ribosomal RNA processing protein 1 like protein B [Pteropus alecto]